MTIPAQPERAARSELIGRILNALNNSIINKDELVRKTGLSSTQVGVTLYKLVSDGRVREARREGRIAFYERVPAAERITIQAQRSAAAGPLEAFSKLKEELDKAILVVTEVTAENGRLRAENDLLRRAHKDLAAKL